MQVEKEFKTKDGKVVFLGNLSQEEINFIFETGLTTLFNCGALPFFTETEDRQLCLDFGMETH